MGESHQLSEHDVVRVVQLLDESRSFTGSKGVRRAPRVGDTGTIVFVLDPTNFIVECVDPEGFTIWLADFTSRELKRISSA